MNRVSTYRLHTGTLRREQMLRGLCGASRYVWNFFVGYAEDAWRAHKETAADLPSLSYFSLGRIFTALRNSDGHEWMREYSHPILKYQCKYFADAHLAARKGTKGFPKRKYRGKCADTFTIPSFQSKKAQEDIRDGRLPIPHVGKLPITRKGGDPHAHGTAKMAVANRAAGHWYVRIVWQLDDMEATDDGREVGVDMNVGQVALSDRMEKLYAPDLSRYERRARRWDRVMKRRKRVPLLDELGLPKRNRKGDIIMVNSRRREKARVRYQKAMRRAANIRHNWCHHVSREVADAAGTAIVEDLQIKNMTASARGTRENPGRNVRQKAGLNRSILGTGWGIVRRMLDYKAAHVLPVPAQYTSQTCRQCGHVSADNRRTQANFECVRCGFKDDADRNAARNILARGQEILAPGKGAAERGIEEKEALARVTACNRLVNLGIRRGGRKARLRRTQAIRLSRNGSVSLLDGNAVKQCT